MLEQPWIAKPLMCVIFSGFLGITDVEFIYAEGLNMGDDAKHKALASAKDRLLELAA